MSFVTAQIREALKDHVLEEVLPETKDFRAFYMKEKDGGRMMSTLFVFTPEGIVIMGDLCPGGPKNQGSISDFNYGLGWFSRQQSEGYLCSKFLTTEWQIEVAERWCREHIEEMKKEVVGADYLKSEPAKTADEWTALLKTRPEWEELLKTLPEWDDLLTQLQGGEIGRDHFHEALQDLDYDVEDEGFEYHLNTAGWLCGLQQRFAELYQKMYPPQPEPVAAQSASDLHSEKKGD
jgi:hypothetical protein